MLQTYHRLITTQALNEVFSPPALEIIIAANLGQDHFLRGQFGHPEYHFDGNTFAESRAFIGRNRDLVRPALEAGDAAAAQRALGRLTHAAQDFYAHSNYVALWLARFPPGGWPSPQEIEPFDEASLHHPDLRSGKIYMPLELFSWVPGLAPLFVPLLPRDSHAWMNLDSPSRGPMFAYALAAALKRTRYEYELTAANLTSEQLLLFRT
jgi:hypothetical protein